MWVIIGTVVLFYIAWCSGEHHARRAKRIVENNRVERRKKWRTLVKENRQLKEELARLRKRR